MTAHAPPAATGIPAASRSHAPSTSRRSSLTGTRLPARRGARRGRSSPCSRTTPSCPTSMQPMKPWPDPLDSVRWTHERGPVNGRTPVAVGELRLELIDLPQRRPVVRLRTYNVEDKVRDAGILQFAGETIGCLGASLNAEQVLAGSAGLVHEDLRNGRAGHEGSMPVGSPPQRWPLTLRASAAAVPVTTPETFVGFDA